MHTNKNKNTTSCPIKTKAAGPERNIYGILVTGMLTISFVIYTSSFYFVVVFFILLSFVQVVRGRELFEFMFA
jgi:hypothetical protein